MNHRRTIRTQIRVGVLLFGMILSGWGANTALSSAQQAPAHITTTNTPDGTCHEDMPCWDCHTMGNRICGPTTTIAVVRTLPVTK